MCIAVGTDAGEGEWHAAGVEKRVVCWDACMAVSGLVRCEGGCVFGGGR